MAEPLPHFGNQEELLAFLTDIGNTIPPRVDKEEWIYILELQNGCYYVGKTNDLLGRLFAHFTTLPYGSNSETNKIGAVWIKTHAVRRLHAFTRAVHPGHEEMVTKEYMALYGWEKVRGAKFVRVRLTSYEIREVFSSLSSWGGTDKRICQKCCKPGHWASECEEKNPLCPDEDDAKQKCPKCGERNHQGGTCGDDCRTLGRILGITEKTASCIARSPKEIIPGPSPKKSAFTAPAVSPGNEKCDRCGRPGHFIEKCYASHHCDTGKELDRSTSMRGVKEARKKAAIDGAFTARFTKMKLGGEQKAEVKQIKTRAATTAAPRNNSDSSNPRPVVIPELGRRPLNSSFSSPVTAAPSSFSNRGPVMRDVCGYSIDISRFSSFDPSLTMPDLATVTPKKGIPRSRNPSASSSPQERLTLKTETVHLSSVVDAEFSVELDVRCSVDGHNHPASECRDQK